MASLESSKSPITQIDPSDDVYILIEQYKEVSTHRRHYSNLRFALFPVYFAIQYGLVQLAFKMAEDEINLLPMIVYAIAGLLVTYVFWTIEERIIQYYNHLSSIGKEMEKEFQGNLISSWPKSSFKSDTKKSILFVYFVFFMFWIFCILRYVLTLFI